MNPEQLRPKDQQLLESHSGSEQDKQLTEQTIQQLADARLASLAEFKNIVGRKFYYAVEDRLQQQQNELRQLLDWQQGKRQKLANYSFILPPQYFEQKFLTHPI